MESGLTCFESRLTQFTDNAVENEDVGNGLLNDLDSYLQEINDRLTISRLVSDSIIKGMVNAISQSADEEIARKELEVSELMNRINLYHVGTDENVSLRIPIVDFENILEHNEVRQSLIKLQNETKGQLQKLKSEIDSIKGCTSVENLTSDHKLVRLEGILSVQDSEKWTNVDKAIGSLQVLLDSVESKVEDVLCLSSLLCQSQVEQKFRADIEDLVIKKCIQRVQEEYEEKILDQNAQFYCDRKGEWSLMMKELLSVRKELDAALIHPENEQLISHSSLDSDLLHRTLNHDTPPTVVGEGNGKHEVSNTIMADNFDPSRLKHLSKEELINYFNSEITQTRRNHESQIQEIIEENFTLKRERLKERGPSLSLKKDKEVESLRKSISDINIKLDEFLRENKNLALLFEGDNNNLESFRGRIRTLRAENSQLRELLGDKEREMKHLSSQASIFEEELAEKSCLQISLLKSIDDLKCEVHDANIVSSFIEEVYKFIFTGLTDQVTCDNEAAFLQAEYDVTSKEAVCNSECAGKVGANDSELEALIMQDIFEFVVREFLKDCQKNVGDLHERYMDEINFRLSMEMELELELYERENALKVEVVEKENLKQKIASLTAKIKEEEKVVQELEDTLAKEREQLKSASQELSDLKCEIRGLQTSILESNKSADVVKGNLDEATKQIKLLMAEKCNLVQKVEWAMDELKDVQVENEKLCILVQENHKLHFSIKAKERKYEEQMKSMVVLAKELINGVSGFGCMVTEYISRSNSRLENLTSQLNMLTQMAISLKRAGSVYKLKLERKCSDLEKAETEVDLLGDQVDALFGLLEKIYIGLDHYSPILKHYSGIVEILKLVKGELIGDRKRSI